MAEKRSAVDRTETRDADSPTVSVILPCFNHDRFIASAMESVLNQSHTDLELIIVDDASSDNSWSIISSLSKRDGRIRLIKHQTNGGLPKSRNDGLRAASGQFIAFCDSDDVWERDKLEMQLDVLHANPEHDVVYTDTLIIDENGSLTGQRFSDRYSLPEEPSGCLFRELIFRNFINVQSALIRKCCLDSVSYFDEDLEALEDWWYWIQLSRHRRFIYMPQPLARYRVHSHSMHSQRKRSFPVSRVKIFGRMLQKYHDLSNRTKADINYQMATDLLALGDGRLARRLLLEAMKLSTTDPRSFSTLGKAAARFVLTAFRSSGQFAPKVFDFNQGVHQAPTGINTDSRRF